MKLRILFFLLALPAMIVAQNQPIDLLIGTYTSNGSKGVYVYAFDPATGSATLRSVAETQNPSFLTISKDRKYVYVANEQGKGKGMATAYAFDAQAGTLTFLNQQPTQGGAPCHITVDSHNRYVIASNYTSGNVSVFPVEPDGRLGALKQFIEYTGSGPDKSRQEAPHVHSAFFTPDEKQVYIQDLGTDKINIYDFRPTDPEGPLVPAAQPFVKSAPGGGPRHLTQSKDGSVVYLVEEMTAKVMVYARQNGRLEAIQEVEINEDGFSGEDGAAEVKMSPDGKFLYASNRGDANTLAIYRVNPADGTLTKIGNQSVLGRGPRNFNISPDGRYLLVANQYTDDVIVFTRNLETGMLTDTGHRLAIPSPVCVVF